MTRGVPAIAIFRRCRRAGHHPLEPETLHNFAVYVERGRFDSKGVRRQAGQSFNIERRAGLGVFWYQWNVFSPKHENVTAMRFYKVIAKLVHEDLVAGIDRASGNHFVAPIVNTGGDLKVGSQLIRWTINQEFLMLADNPRPGEEKEKFPLLDLQHLIVLLGDHVDVITAANNEFSSLPKNIRWRRSHRAANDSIEGRLHRSRRNFERLQEIRSNPDCDYDRDQNYFDIFAPMRFPGHRR